tara:strand:+ start:213 stop:1103 length:891 start_codon:yes stop_codon:yes gene_type:complete
VIVKNFVNKIYIFSKLSIVLILLFLLFFTLYIFYKSYQKQGFVLQNTDNKNKLITNLIEENSNQIKQLNKNINEINISFNNLQNTIKSDVTEIGKADNELSTFLDEIINEIKQLKNDLNDVKVANKNLKPLSNTNEIKLNNFNETIKLIKLKFENGKEFTQEIDLLNEIVKIESQPYIEKLYIINDLNFKGNEKLFLIYMNETDKYIESNFLTKNIIIKNLTSFIDIQPSQNNNLQKTELIQLKKVNKLILEKKYEKSENILRYIDAEKKYFNRTTMELDKANKFYDTIKKIINNG